MTLSNAPRWWLLMVAAIALVVVDAAVLEFVLPKVHDDFVADR